MIDFVNNINKHLEKDEYVTLYTVNESFKIKSIVEDEELMLTIYTGKRTVEIVKSYITAIAYSKEPSLKVLKPLNK